MISWPLTSEVGVDELDDAFIHGLADDDGIVANSGSLECNRT